MTDPLTAALKLLKIETPTPTQEWLLRCSDHLEAVRKQRMERNKDESV